MYKLYVIPIGQWAPEVTEFTNEDIAKEVFKQSCSPILAVESWLLYCSERMQCILDHWHMREEKLQWL